MIARKVDRLIEKMRGDFGVPYRVIMVGEPPLEFADQDAAIGHAKSLHARLPDDAPIDAITVFNPEGEMIFSTATQRMLIFFES